MIIIVYPTAPGWFYLFICVFIYLFIYFKLFLFIYLFIYPCITCIILFVYMFNNKDLWIKIILFIHQETTWKEAGVQVWSLTNTERAQ